MFLSGIVIFAGAGGHRPGLGIGDPVPDFSLIDQDGITFRVKDHIGRKILVIYFYPMDETRGCTKEACTFRDNFADFTAAGALVIGINSAGAKSHKRFGTHHNLPFILLSDPGNKVLRSFGVRNKFFITGRETFVVDLSGKIAFTFNAFREADRHVEEALKCISKLTNQ